MDCFFLDNDGHGNLKVFNTYPRFRLAQPVRFTDIDQDGIEEAIHLNVDLRNPAVIILKRVAGQGFTQQDWYPLTEGPGIELLTGDIDVDGDTDLVVVAPSTYESGGVYVLRNQTAQAPTAITAAFATLPQDVTLGPRLPQSIQPAGGHPLHFASTGDGESEYP